MKLDKIYRLLENHLEELKQEFPNINIAFYIKIDRCVKEYLEHISKVLRVESEEKIITTLQKDKDTWVKEYKKCLGPMAYPLHGLSLEESKERILYDPLANIGLIDILLNSLNIKSEAAEEKHELTQISFAKKEKQRTQNELGQRYSIIEASIIAYKIMDKNILNHVEKLSKEHGLAEQSFKNKNRELSDLNTPHNPAKLRREPLNNWVGAKEHILNFEQHKERYKVNFKILLAYYDDQKYSDYMQFYQNL